MEDAGGVDALILHLLTDLGASREASQFAGRPGCRADVKHLRGRLSSAGQDAALAHLAATCGHSQEALQLWRVPLWLPPLKPFICVESGLESFLPHDAATCGLIRKLPFSPRASGFSVETEAL